METKVENPDFVSTFEADSRGRINLGAEFAGKTVRVAVGVKDDEKETGDNN